MKRQPGWKAEARALVVGTAHGPALVLDKPLSFWGGLDSQTGLIIDIHHPQRGAAVSGRVLVMTAGRGSSSSSSVFAEAIRAGTGPAAVLLAEADEIIVLGALVVELLDGHTCPVLVLRAADHHRIATDDDVAVEPSGRVTVTPPAGRRGSPPPGQGAVTSKSPSDMTSSPRR